MRKTRLEGPWLLALDTATETLAVALGSGPEPVAEVAIHNGRTHATTVMEAIGQVLKLAGMEPGELDGFIVGRGPGSFTGLRIGLATIKGMALGLSKPVVSVSSLACLAFQAALEGLEIWAVMDARRGQVYCCRYRVTGRDVEPLETEQVLDPGRLVAMAEGPCLLVGSGALKYREFFRSELGSGAVFAAANQNRIQPASLVRLGWRKWCLREAVDGEKVVPLYLRRPDAELARENE